MSAEPITWIGIAALAVSNIGIWIDKLMVGRRNGKGIKLCGDHSVRIATLETDTQNLKINHDDLGEKIETVRTENREDHQGIFDKIRKI